jgi:flagellar hook-associated protein 2
MLQTAINGTSAFSSASSTVTVAANATTGFLSIASNRYGSASNVSLSNGLGTTVATFMGATPATTVGVDVAGSINGVAATGSGQYLTGVDGLKLLVNGGAVGQRGSVSFSQGYAYQLNNLVSGYLANPSIISGRTDGINQSIKDIGTQRDDLNRRLTATEARYRAQFTQLDALISSMNQTSSYLTQQLAALPKG